MKRMVKNGDLLDISEDGSNATFGGNLKVGGTIIANGEVRGGDVSASKFYLGTEEMPLVKANPTGEATQTLEKVKIGNVAYKVGGGSNYTAGSNIKISEAKEISVKSDITGINSIKFAGNSTPEIGIVDGANLKIKSNSNSFDYPAINLYRYGYDETYKKRISLIFYADDISYNVLTFDCRDFGDTNYVFITKGSKVPPVPSGNGTYVLKATVSGSTITYTWVAE